MPSWKYFFQREGTLKVENYLGRYPMARLFTGEKECRFDDVLRLLQRHQWGLRESEVAEILQWHRRTVNNYLRDLQAQKRVHKEGRLWFLDE